MFWLRLKKTVSAVVENIKRPLKTIKRTLLLIKSNNNNDNLRYFLALSMGTASVGINMYMPKMYSMLHESFEKLTEDSKNYEIFHETLKLILLFSVVTNAINIIRSATDSIIAPVFRKKANRITLEFLKKINNSSQDFFDEHTHGEILDKITKVRSSLTDTSLLIVHGIPSTIDFFIGAISLFKYKDKNLIFYWAVYFCLCILFARTSSNKLHSHENSERVALEKLDDMLIETFSNSNTVNIFFEREQHIQKCKSILDAAELKTNVKENYSNIFSITQHILSILSTLLFRFFAISNIKNGMLNVSQYRSLDYLLSQVTYPIDSLYGYFKIARVIIKDINNYYDLMEQLKPQNFSEKSLNLSSGVVSFSNVIFLRKNEKIIDDISFNMKTNQVTAIVGCSGAGKTSLAKLLLRSFDATSGQILIDDQNIRDISLDSLRSHVSIASQEPTIFNGSLTFNILCGRKNISKNEIIDIINNCCLESLLKLDPDPDKIILGKYGIKISGGQKQLIGLARMIALNPSIVIYDEAFSQIDNQTFMRILPVIGKLNENKSVLWIDHNLHHTKNSNKIIVMDKGKIVEEGMHNDLLKIQNGIYNALWRYQSSEYSIGCLVGQHGIFSDNKINQSTENAMSSPERELYAQVI